MLRSESYSITRRDVTTLNLSVWSFTIVVETTLLSFIHATNIVH